MHADVAPLWVDLEKHMHRHEVDYPEDLRDLFRVFLAVFALHAASRPKHQVLAWTLNFQKPLFNLFLAADTDLDSVTGRIFTENIRQGEDQRFYQESARIGQPVMRSICLFSGNDPFLAAETFYRQSEQRLARFFQIAPTEFSMLVAHPDCDETWLTNLSHEDIHGLSREEKVVPIEIRPLRWFCGCNEERLLHALAAPYRMAPEDLFAQEEMLEAQCPRCASRYRLRREAMEAYVAKG